MAITAKLVWNKRKFMIALQGASDKKLHIAAEMIAQTAKSLVPVGEFERAARPGQAAWKQRKPGTLRDSIKVYKSKYKNGGYIIITGGYLAYYWRFVELGAPKRSTQQWRKRGHPQPVPRQPYMRPALKRNKKAIMYIYRNLI